MSSVSNVIVVELPVATVALIGAFGWVYQRLIAKLNTLTEHMTRSLVAEGIMEKDVSDLKKTVPQMREALAVVVSELDSHQRWHERQPYRSATGS